ncbi:MAG: hypothetical protein ACRD50_01430 [Candidatus Acidiferrales bacterium]
MKKIGILGIFAVVSVILTLAFSTAAPARPNVPFAKNVSAASTQPAATTATPQERHPEIRQAIEALRRAQEHLRHGAHDFGGHRVDALKATDNAIHQLEICLKYDKD